MDLFTLEDHPNTLAPLAPDNLLVVLHNLGPVRWERERVRWVVRAGKPVWRG